MPAIPVIPVIPVIPGGAGLRACPGFPPKIGGNTRGVVFRIVEIPEVQELFFVLIAIRPF